jgi:hypothetical protein
MKRKREPVVDELEYVSVPFVTEKSQLTMLDPANPPNVPSVVIEPVRV